MLPTKKLSLLLTKKLGLAPTHKVAYSVLTSTVAFTSVGCPPDMYVYVSCWRCILCAAGVLVEHESTYI